MTKINDSLENLFVGDTGPVRTVPVRPDAVACTPAEQRFEEGCPKCRGRGRGRFISYSGRDCGPCFACKGAGKKTFKTAPEVREQNRERAAERKARVETESVDAWKAANPQAYEWLVNTAPRWELAQSLLNGLQRYGSLTDKQMGIVRNGMIRDAERAAQQAARAADAPAVDTAGINRLKVAFDQAVTFSAEKGLRLSPRITVDGVTISPAKATSKNPGALYVKQRGGDYLGKIVGGRFFAVPACDSQTQAKVLAFIADPAEAAKVYGQTTGTCCICNATLTSKWKERGIGPICAEKFGWA